MHLARVELRRVIGARVLAVLRRVAFWLAGSGKPAQNIGRWFLRGVAVACAGPDIDALWIVGGCSGFADGAGQVVDGRVATWGDTVEPIHEGIAKALAGRPENAVVTTVSVRWVSASAAL